MGHSIKLVYMQRGTPMQVWNNNMFWILDHFLHSFPPLPPPTAHNILHSHDNYNLLYKQRKLKNKK